MTEIGKPEEDAGRGGSPVTVFVSDPSAEAERLAQGLRSAGYAVVDVPLSMLVARVAVQRPRVLLLDADADGAMDVVERVRELSETDAIDVVFLGRPGAALSGIDDALAHEGSGFFARPVDVAALLRKVDALTGGANRAAPPRPTTPPPSLPSSRPPPSGHPSLPPPSMRSPGGARPTPPPRGSVMPSLGTMELSAQSIRKVTSVQAPLSGELEALLVEAEQRIGGQLAHESMLPSPEEEIEAVLPAEMLASLDEPVDDDEDDAVPNDAALGAHAKGNTTGAGKLTTGGGPAPTGAGTPQPPHTAARTGASEASLPPAPKTHGGTNAGSTGASTTGLRAGSEILARDVSASPPAVVRPQSSAPRVEVIEGGSEPSPRLPLALAAPPPPPPPPPVPAGLSPSPVGVPTVLGPADAPRVLAEAIAGRGTGVLAFESAEGTRRIVLREGDVVTAASSLDEEALLPFLAARGELPRDRVAQLAGKVPAGGRHAGAALVAHGYMRQDQLWTVLRAHAEWVIGRVVALEGGTAGFEADAGGRLRSEPSVFGGSTGAEVFVEVVRRGVSPGVAIERMGGEASRVVAGSHESLTSECALGAAEMAWLGRARGKTIGEALASAGDPDFAAVLYALVSLGVCDVVRTIGAPPRVQPAGAAPPSVDPLDEEAIRARVRARMQLVEEGDYFAVLGVSRDATSYEVKRAFLELRRGFEPSKLLTPGLADLVEDVKKIASVLDEAYEILRDGGRRDRYRRAIDAVPR